MERMTYKKKEKYVRIREMIALGYTYAQIVEKLNCSMGTISRALKIQELPAIPGIVNKTLEIENSIPVVSEKRVIIPEKHVLNREDIIIMKRILKSIINRKNAQFKDEAKYLLEVL